MSDVTRALKNWQDYKEIRVSGDSKSTANAEKLIALFTKVAGQGTFEIARVDSSNWYGRETGILIMYKTPEAFAEIKKLFKEFCESLGYKYSRSGTMFDAYSANAVYELENTQNFAGIYRNPTPDKDLGIELVLLKLREFL